MTSKKNAWNAKIRKLDDVTGTAVVICLMVNVVIFAIAMVGFICCISSTITSLIVSGIFSLIIAEILFLTGDFTIDKKRPISGVLECKLIILVVVFPISYVLFWIGYAFVMHTSESLWVSFWIIVGLAGLGALVGLIYGYGWLNYKLKYGKVGK